MMTVKYQILTKKNVHDIKGDPLLAMAFAVRVVKIRIVQPLREQNFQGKSNTLAGLRL